VATEVTVTLRFEFDEYVPEPTELAEIIERHMFYEEDNPVTAEVVDYQEV
jgi:hypothetical protein